MTVDPGLITHLRHVDLAIPDYEKQLAFYTEVWGLAKVAEDSGIAFLAAEGSPERYVIRLRKDPLKRLDLVSFGAASEADVMPYSASAWAASASWAVNSMATCLARPAERPRDA